MASRPDTTLPPAQRARQSIGALSSAKTVEKENGSGSQSLVASRRKSRSKSIGPGGLDALKQSAGNRRQSIAVLPKSLPRGILKPSPVPEIPPHRKRADLSGVRGSKSQSPDVTRSNGSSASGSKIAVRTEEEQQAAAREREERDRRDARRKSLANRRVSFATEATLHTFHEIEFFQDSTTSTEATRRQSQRSNAASHDETQDNTTEPELEPEKAAGQAAHSHNRRRRRSSIVSTNEDETAMSLYSDDSIDDTVEEEIVEDDDASSSSSDDGTLMTVDEAEVTGVSAMSARTMGSDDEGSTLAEALRIASESAGSNISRRPVDSDDLDDGEEAIPAFVPWSKRSRDRPTPAPAPASPTTNDGVDDSDAEKSDAEMDMDMTQGVGGILAKTDGDQTMGVDMGMDMTEAIGQILKPQPRNSPSPSPSPSRDQEEDSEADMDMDMSMEVTRAIGGIIQRGMQGSSPLREEQQQEPANEVDANEIDEDEDEIEEQTMELTKVVGGIRRQQPDESVMDVEGDEEMSMEFTTIMGGLLNKNKPASQPHEVTMGMDVDMDMTVGLGRILPTTEESGPNEEEDVTEGMEMTVALGSIMDKPAAETRSLAKKIMEAEVNEPHSPMKAAVLAVSRSSSPQHRRNISTRSTPQPSPAPQPTAATSKTATPKTPTSRAPATRNKSATPQTRSSKAPERQKTPERPKSPVQAQPPTPDNLSVQSSPVRTVSPIRVNPAAATTPTGESPVRLVRRSPRRSKSPEKATSAAPTASRPSIFQTGSRMPNIVLTPQKRTLSGHGIDRPGLGSPKVSAIFDRRGSIGETAADFVPGLSPPSRAVRFQDPRAAEREEDRERQREHDKENGRTVLEREADEGEPIFNLREIIASLSPKKNPLRGRKSLHVGSASGLLGKRPVELDSDDEDRETQDGVKRLKGLQSSPVKNIHLPQPEITVNGRRHSPSVEPVAATPIMTRSPARTPAPATTPEHLGHFKDVSADNVTPLAGFSTTPRVLPNDAVLEQDGPDDRIKLQDFLNMTSIRFMELNTTRRRHTVAPSEFANGRNANSQDLSLERCVVAGTCTVPMLELYQHSCGELKNYISDGRRMVREIEDETYQDNPPLFREYMSATSEIRSLMDTQFKNVKTHARLLSKAMWYEWRMKLQDGLKEGLVRILDGMHADDEALKKQEELLASTLPSIEERFEAMRAKHDELVERARELDDCDPEELEAARTELMAIDKNVKAKRELVEKLRARLEAAETGLEETAQRKQTCLDEISEAERVREDCRGWTMGEVGVLKGRVDALERKHGWSVARITSSAITMSYKSQVEVSFAPTGFGSACTVPVEVRRVVADHEAESRQASADQQAAVVKQFFLRCVQNRVNALQQLQPTPAIGQLLQVVRAGWDTALAVAAQITRVGLAFPTTVVVPEPSTSTDSNTLAVAVNSSMLLVPLKSRVEISLVLEGECGGETLPGMWDGSGGGTGPGGAHVTITPTSRVIYGEHFNAVRMNEFLANKIGTAIGQKGVEGDWSGVLVELKGRLIARAQR